MSNHPLTRLTLATPLVLALAATIARHDAGTATAAAPAALLGPPWISIEYPPTPYDPAARDAYLLVHAFHHGTPKAFPVSGTAEGLVGGERRSLPLQFTPTSRTGVYALRKQWADGGSWALVISVTQQRNALATALVRIGDDGGIASVKVPTTTQDGWKIPRRVTAAEVDAALRETVATR